MLPSPGDFQSFSTNREERTSDRRKSINPDSTKDSQYAYEEEKNHYQSQSQAHYEDDSRKQDFTNFSNFEAPSRTENQSISNFNQFSSYGEEVKNDDQPAPSDFATFSDFNTVKPSSGFDTFTSAPEGKFEDFKQWESTNATTAAANQGGQSDFAGFSSFNQPAATEDVQEKKEGFNDFGNFDSFQTTSNNRKSEAPADNFAQFNSFDQKPVQDSTPKSSFQNFSGGRSSLHPEEASDDKKRQFDTAEQSISDHQQNFDYHGGAGSVEDISFSQGGNPSETNATHNEEMIQNRLSRSKSIDTTKFDYVDTIFKELTAHEVLDKNEVTNARDAWIKILENFYIVRIL